MNAKWTPKEENVLKEMILTMGFSKGCEEAAKSLKRSRQGCTTRARKLKDAGYMTYTPAREVIAENTRTNAAILKRAIMDNPDNLHEAFKVAAKKTGLDAHTIESYWYSKDRSLSRDVIGTCFLLASEGRTLANRKNTIISC